ncbi:unknown protein [Bathycoccus prasinos]|jgi:hypothetical protein|uniref:Uncharacterized protein n=1 Tax=Bathycoccus prasinos TaxID=41875 RepID=K8ELY4_9CHLO|nr:unknown protein [Bathycoccus prasinos]CCO19257.1 unknown protein [Bathycoccus prasinos]|eukprot:XP_007509454.1 unknown protein [Bathycoccus prasinos]
MLKDTENDDFEPSDITDSLGGFTLNIIARDSAKLPKVIIKTDSNEGCVDSFTNAKPGMLTLRAPMDASVITPLTTVAIEIASVYLITVERAAELILESIGLAEESIDSDLIFKIDPFQKLVIDGDDSIATVAYASVNVANAISMISSLLYGAGTSSKAEAEAATLLAFAKRIGDTNLVLRKKRRILLKKYTKRLNVSDSSDISSIISSAVSVVSRTSPDVRVDTAAKNAVAQASASASSYLLSTNTTSESYSGEAISKICAAAVKVLQDPELLEAIFDLGRDAETMEESTLIRDLQSSATMSAKYETAKASVSVVIPQYPSPPSPPPHPPPPLTIPMTLTSSDAVAPPFPKWTIWWLSCLTLTIALAAS